MTNYTQNAPQNPVEELLALEAQTHSEAQKTPVEATIGLSLTSLSEEDIEKLNTVIVGNELAVMRHYPEVFTFATSRWSEAEKQAGLERIAQQAEAFKASIDEQLQRLERAQPKGDADCSMIEQHMLVIDPKEVKA
ncbi:hypothetical protein SAMN04515648_2955 [Phyllobacterium sp. CL33Tsu]|uniref:hypothetical protein n=1 Tax=Phyllobacterium sp. CL33Tsu TaxID=1798191 RepID=UPI0008E9D9FB|nr:hypothetical protein [Phyllobacterium sp. CL33Tsu]SFJ16463.1 hypothetical protein SAMN04515648_2955 [Phyllobacterium sp. CL33Tsu]